MTTQLTLMGVSEDGERLLLVDDQGARFSLPVDHRLRSALRGDHARLGQLEIEMDSALRPRDIQARIRAGESAEAVAEAAQATLDKIMPFAGPVLAERAHMADRAQRSTVRRPPGAAGDGGRTLGEVISARLVDQHLRADALEWDAWKREDGRWQLVASVPSGPQAGPATFLYDVPGNFVVADDDAARWLLGESIGTAQVTPKNSPDAGPEADAGPEGGPAPARRRLSAVPSPSDEPLPWQEDESPAQAETSRADSGADPDATTADLSETAAAVREAPKEPPFFDEVFAHADQDPRPPWRGWGGNAPGQPLEEVPAPPAAEPSAEAEQPAPTAEPEHTQPIKRTGRKGRGRTSVPSWDEIMFGNQKPE